MKYLTINEAKSLPGLRLVLTAGVPGPWGESAKAIFRHKDIPFIPVAQQLGGLNEELEAWTGQTSAPAAILNNEPARTSWLDILMLAERMNPHKPLLPAAVEDRALVIGLSHELAGEQGFTWDRRLQMFAPSLLSDNPPEGIQRMGAKYGWSEENLLAANDRLIQRTRYFAQRLHSQRALGSDYLVGDALTALDIYFANFIATVKPLPPEHNPMPDHMRQAYENVPEALALHLDPILFGHRDLIYQRHLQLPLDF